MPPQTVAKRQDSALEGHEYLRHTEEGVPGSECKEELL